MMTIAFVMVSTMLCVQNHVNATQDDQTVLTEHTPRSMFVDTNGRLSQHLITLLRLDRQYTEGDGLVEAVRKTQAAWISTIQGRGQIERTDLVDSPERQKIHALVEQCSQEMGLFAARSPRLQHYTYGVCHGAFLSGVRQNLAQLIVAWKRGVRFDSIVFLTGERTLRKEPGKQDCEEALGNGTGYPFFKKGWTKPTDAPYETEYDMVRLVWDQTELPQDMAEALRERVTFVNAPRGTHERPSTKDAFTTWISTSKPQPGTIVACSYPLLWSYQQLAGETVLQGSGLVLDTTAPEATDSIRAAQRERLVSLIFDTVAKCLYEISLTPQ